ncbi:MAG: BON domain-containing protein [Armatimonadetes bacterium]|nr:BON domain-containing protein [Armatimonadota bacterium]
MPPERQHTRPDWWVALKVRLGLAYEFIGLGDFFSISVSCKHGHVVLTGAVRNEYRQCRTEEVAWRVKGVKKVESELAIREGPHIKRKAPAAIAIWPVPPLLQIPVEELTEEEQASAEAVLRTLHARGVPTGPGGVRARVIERTAYVLDSAPDSTVARKAAEATLTLPQVDQVRSKLRVRDGSGGRRALTGASEAQT